MTGSRTRQALVLLLVFGVLRCSWGRRRRPRPIPPSARSRLRRAQILDQIHEMDSQVAKAIEAYNYAECRARSGSTGISQANGRHLVVAKAEPRDRAGAHRGAAARALRQRPRERSGRGDPRREEPGRRPQPARCRRAGGRSGRAGCCPTSSGSAPRFASGGASSRRHEQQQAEVVAERAASKAWIEEKLGERQRLYASVKNEIADLEAQERQPGGAARRRRRARGLRRSVGHQAGGPRVDELDGGGNGRSLGRRRRRRSSSPLRLPRSTPASWASRCSTSECRTSGVG